MTDLERRLHALAPEAFPPVPDVRAAVTESITTRSRATNAAPRARRWRFDPGYRGQFATRTTDDAGPARRRRVLALALALVLVPTAAVAAVPDARHAVLDWLGLAHVRVERAPEARVPPLPPLDLAVLGQRVASVAEAGRRAGFAVAVPRALGTPDAVYVSRGGIVSLAYAPRPGLPRDTRTGLGALVTELRAAGITKYLAKTAGPRTVVEPVRVDGARGVFLSGEPHELLIEQPDRMVRPLPARLAGNALAFERGDLVLRLEGRFDREHALALARTLRAGGA